MKHGLEHDKPEDVEEEDLPEGVILRDHVVDGIREYDQRLPMWWLIILFSVIFFSIIYWVVIDDRRFEGGVDPALEIKLAELQTKKLSSSIDVTNNDLFYEMASNSTFVSAGKESFEANCIACHGKNLQGGIGFNLVDKEWVHGAHPSEIYVSIADGFPDKGMQPWESLLGQKRIAEVVAYIISENDLEDLKAAQEIDATKSAETSAAEIGTPSNMPDSGPEVESFAMGKNIYERNCAACHGADRKGVANLGSDLTDGIWAYGGSKEDIIKVVRDGIMEKGMIAWDSTLTDEEIIAVAEYILD